MNAALGGESAGGLGTPESDVTQMGGGPSAFVASQSGGSAVGLTLSKFSVNTTGREQGGEHEGAGAGGASPAAESLIRPQLSCPVEGDLIARWAMAREEPIAAATTMQAVMSNREQTSGRNRDDVRLGCVLIPLAISVVRPARLTRPNAFT
jgi:hypothetical protein